MSERQPSQWKIVFRLCFSEIQNIANGTLHHIYHTISIGSFHLHFILLCTHYKFTHHFHLYQLFFKLSCFLFWRCWFLISSSSDKSSDPTRLPGSIGFPPFLFSCFFGPTPQFSLRTSKSDWLKENSFTFVVSFVPGNLFKTSFLSSGWPVAWKPDTRFSGFRKQINLYNDDGKMVFRRLSAHQNLFSNYLKCYAIQFLLVQTLPHLKADTNVSN